MEDFGHIDQRINLAFLTLDLMVTKNFKHPFNLSNLKRPPKLYTRPLVQLAAMTTIYTLAGVSYPLYLMYQTDTSKAQIPQENQLVQKYEGQLRELQSVRDVKLAEEKKLMTLLEVEKTKLQDRLIILDAIYNKKNNSESKVELLVALFKHMNKLGVKVENISFNDKFIRLEILANTSSLLTQFGVSIQNDDILNQFIIILGDIEYKKKIKKYTTAMRLDRV